MAWEWLLACPDKFSSCNHAAAAKSGAKSKVVSLGRACQKSCFKIPQFPRMAQEILWVISHNAQLGAGYSCSQLLPKQLLPLCHPPLEPHGSSSASTELLLLLLETQCKAWEQLRKEGAVVEQRGLSRGNTSTAGHHCQLQEPAHATPRGSGDVKGKFLHLAGE